MLFWDGGGGGCGGERRWVPRDAEGERAFLDLRERKIPAVRAIPGQEGRWAETKPETESCRDKGGVRDRAGEQGGARGETAGRAGGARGERGGGLGLRSCRPLRLGLQLRFFPPPSSPPPRLSFNSPLLGSGLVSSLSPLPSIPARLGLRLGAPFPAPSPGAPCRPRPAPGSPSPLLRPAHRSRGAGAWAGGIGRLQTAPGRAPVG